MFRGAVPAEPFELREAFGKAGGGGGRCPLLSLLAWCTATMIKVDLLDGQELSLAHLSRGRLSLWGGSSRASLLLSPFEEYGSLPSAPPPIPHFFFESSLLASW